MRSDEYRAVAQKADQIVRAIDRKDYDTARALAEAWRDRANDQCSAALENELAARAASSGAVPASTRTRRASARSTSSSRG